jgi:hypothetical protein
MVGLLWTEARISDIRFNMDKAQPRQDRFDVLADFDSGELERRVAMDQIFVPMSVELVDESLVFAEYPLTNASARQIRDRGTAPNYADHRTGRRRAPHGATWRLPRRGLLEGFAALASGTDEEIRAYARRWGGLMPCVHGLPRTHAPYPTPMPSPMPNPIPWCHPLGWGGHSWWEPLDAWRSLARRAEAMLEVAAALRSKQTGPRDSWNVILDGPEAYRIAVADTPDGHSALLSRQVQRWLTIAQVGPQVFTSRGKFVVRFGAPHLFGAVAYQLALAVCDERGHAQCSKCQHMYLPRRRPAPGKRTYCEDCERAGAPVRDAERDYRARKRRAQQMNRGGVSEAAIACELGSRRDVVRGWLRGRKKERRGRSRT